MGKTTELRKLLEAYAERLVKKRPDLVPPGKEVFIQVGLRPLKHVSSEDLPGSGNTDFKALADLPFDARSRTVFTNAGINSLDALLQKSIPELLAERNCGYGVISDIRRCLHEHGLNLRGAPPFTGQLLAEDLGLNRDVVERLKRLGINSVADVEARLSGGLAKAGLKACDLKAVTFRLEVMRRKSH